MLEKLFLPPVQSEFESAYLAKMNRIAAWFFIAHLPVFVLIAWFNGTGPQLAFWLTLATLAGPITAILTKQPARKISILMGVTAMLMGGLLVHFGQGPVQIEMHFYFFVLLALLAVFANPMVIIAAALTVTLHHALLWCFIPESVFNYDAPFWVVAVHAAFVVLESVAACFIARSFYENVIGLERKVNERTQELRQRGEQMRRLLDSVQQGFFSVNREGVISEERSRAANSLLEIHSSNDRESRMRFSEVLRAYDPAAADWFELGIEDVFAGVMPLEVTLDQLPKKCIVHSKSLLIDYSPVLDGDAVAGLTVTVSDISAEVERQKLAQENRELLALFEHVSKDSARVAAFLQESESIIDALRFEGIEMVPFARMIHTLKGNSAALGMERFAKACHEIEDAIAAGAEVKSGKAWDALLYNWEMARNNIRRFLKSEVEEITIRPDEYEALLNDIQYNESRLAIAQRVRSWKCDSVDRQLERLCEHAKTLSHKLGKQVKIEIDGSGLRADKQRWAEFWSGLTHVVRNSLDHGIETSSERVRLSKPPVGTITLQSKVEGDRFHLTISDDGRGIDWDCVRETARRKNLPAETQQDLVDALFRDGFSTANEVSEVSGRGIGMAAVKQFTENLGGSISIQTQRGQGTELRFSFPLSTLIVATQESGPVAPVAAVNGTSDANLFSSTHAAK